MRRICLILVALLACSLPARADVVDDALGAAAAAFARAAPQLGAGEFGVDTAAYRDVLMRGRFFSGYWGGEIAVNIIRGGADGACSRFAAHVILPPQNGAVSLVLCRQFIDTGTPALRALTVLHEMVHVVAGPNECRAMAFAARIELLATGSFTPVERYWQANGCDSSGFLLP